MNIFEKMRFINIKIIGKKTFSAINKDAKCAEGFFLWWKVVDRLTHEHFRRRRRDAAPSSRLRTPRHNSQRVSHNFFCTEHRKRSTENEKERRNVNKERARERQGVWIDKGMKRAKCNWEEREWKIAQNNKREREREGDNNKGKGW